MVTLPLTLRLWNVVNKDFIVDLSKSHRLNMIFVVLDHFTKQAHFVLAKPPLIASQIAKLFFKNLSKYHGLTTMIVFDQDGHL